LFILWITCFWGQNYKLFALYQSIGGKINAYLFCISLDLHYLCIKLKGKGYEKSLFIHNGMLSACGLFAQSIGTGNECQESISRTIL